ncbi:MAG TPA: glycosyltransferase [Vicinamibacterales bacterium]|nr:glycosyltransferase [Vicinamibacterales bacterium]
MTPRPDLSVVIPTHDRPADLELVIDALMHQQTDGLTYEVIVVDNNSRGETREVVERAIAKGTPVPLIYVREPRPGVSYARNTGASIARAPLIGFLDDDGVPTSTWVREITRAFDEHPGFDCIGGRVRPIWRTPPPSWMTPAQYGPIAIQDRAEPFVFDRDHATSCLSSANLACRREAFEEVGGFSPVYLRSQDREFGLRLWEAGKRGLYLPIADVLVEVPANRLTKAYHRQWQSVVAHYAAIMRYRDRIDPEGRLVPDGMYRTFLAVPRFMYRECLVHIGRWLRAALTGRSDERFHHELRLRYYFSYFRTRWATARGASPRRRTLNNGVPHKSGTGVRAPVARS